MTPSRDPVTNAPQDIAGSLVEIALVPGPAPSESDWQPAVWTGTASADGSMTARLLVSPVDFGLVSGSVAGVYVRVIDSPEIPVIKAGRLYIK